MKTASLLNAAARGAAFLDSNFPRWEQRIDTEDFDVGDSGCCVLGQMFDDYMNGTTALGLNAPAAAHLGFYVRNSPHRDSRYRFLTDAWRGEISKRLAA